VFGLGDQCVEVFGPPGLHLVQFYSEVHGLGSTWTGKYKHFKLLGFGGTVGGHIFVTGLQLAADPANILECMSVQDWRLVIRPRGRVVHLGNVT